MTSLKMHFKGCKTTMLGEAEHCFEQQLVSSPGHYRQLQKTVPLDKLKYLLVKCLSFQHPTTQELFVIAATEI